MKQVKLAYQHLVQYLQATITEIRWQDLWWGQTDFPELAVGFEYPALFFEFAGNTNDAGQSSQDLELGLNLYLATNQLNETSQGGEMGSLEFLELQSRIYAALHTYTSNETSTLRFRGFSRHGSPSNILVYKLNFATTLFLEEATDFNHTTTPVELTTITPSRIVNTDPPTPPDDEPWFDVKP